MSSPKKPRRRKAGAKAATPKSLPELLAELPPPPPRDATAIARSSSESQPEPIENVEPLFEPELLAAAHANPELVDTTVIGRDSDDAASNVAASNVDIVANPDLAVPRIDAATSSDEPVAAVAAQAEAPELVDTPIVDTPIVADRTAADAAAVKATSHADGAAVKATSEPELSTAHDAEGEGTEVVEAPACGATIDERAPRRGGLPSAARIAASALGKAKELKHKLDDALAAHPIAHRASTNDAGAVDTNEHALAKYNELAHGTNALEAVGHEHAVAGQEHVDTHVGSSEHELEIDKRVSANERAIERDLQLRASSNSAKHVAHDEEPHHVLAADGSVYEPEPHLHVDQPVEKGIRHERDALADAHRLVVKLGDDSEPAPNKKLAAEKVREGDPTVDRLAGARDIDAAYQHEVVAKAEELEHHLESEVLDREHPRGPEGHTNERKRATIAEVEPVPTTSDELHRERALFLGGAAWVVGGLAAVVLGILAVAGVGRPFVLVELAFLVAGVSILVSSLANGARVLAAHDLREHREHREHEANADARDIDDAIAQPPSLHARASERRVELHR
jgi:hypothetical protein